MSKQAVLYRMVLGPMVCPYGTMAKELLQQQGYEVDDRLLTSRQETNAFKAKHNIKTTPLTFIDGEPVGGYDDLVRYFKK